MSEKNEWEGDLEALGAGSPPANGEDHRKISTVHPMENLHWSSWIFSEGTSAHGEPTLEQIFS